MHANFFGLVTFSLLLVACGDKPSSGELTRKIDERLAEKPVCLSFKDGNDAQFPIKITHAGSLNFGAKDPEEDPVLSGLVKGGYMVVTKRREPGLTRNGFIEIDLTNEGRRSEVWDQEKGACIGRRKVVDVINWTEPAASSKGILTTRINYKWTIVDMPKWAQEGNFFAGVRGVGKEIDDVAVAHKMSDGWKIIED